jgi:hypothetical protein
MNAWREYGVAPWEWECRDANESDGCGEPVEWACLFEDGDEWVATCGVHARRPYFTERVNLAELFIVGMTRAHEWGREHGENAAASETAEGPPEQSPRADDAGGTYRGS